MTTTVHVFDPAMCCSTGICGPSVDPQLVRFAADLDALKTQGIVVERFNLSQQPGAFAGDADVRRALEEKGEGALPLIKVDGVMKSAGTYPERVELSAWAGLGGHAAKSLYTDAVAELVAIGAAIAAGCESCFTLHTDKAKKLGVSTEDMRRAVDTAMGVRDSAARAVIELADRHLKAVHHKTLPVMTTTAEATDCCEPAAAKPVESTAAKASGGGCCGPSTTTSATTATTAITTTANKTGCC